MTSLVWVSLVATWVLIWRVWIWRGPVAGVMRAGTRRRPGMIAVPASLSFTDPGMGGKKRF